MSITFLDMLGRINDTSEKVELVIDDENSVVKSIKSEFDKISSEIANLYSLCEKIVDIY